MPDKWLCDVCRKEIYADPYMFEISGYWMTRDEQGWADNEGMWRLACHRECVNPLVLRIIAALPEFPLMACDDEEQRQKRKAEEEGQRCEQRQAALAKLTLEERQALGV